MAGFGSGSKAEQSIPVGGIYATVSVTPAAAAYSAADVMSVAKEVTFRHADGAVIPAGSLIRITQAIIKIDITSVPAGQTAYTGHFYNVTPPSAQADNDAWTLAATDLTAYLGSLALGTPADLGACNFIKTAFTSGADFQLTSTASSMWLALVTDGAHTAAAVARQISFLGQLL